jgi:Tfp pilus assembly protein PilN
MALREINLIPADILSFRYLLRHLFFWARCLTLLLSLIGGFFLYQTHFVINKKRSTTDLQTIHTRMGTRMEEINRIQQELERLDQQQDVLKTIKRNQPYSGVLFKLADIMNEDTWLTRLSVDSDMNTDKGGTENLALTGFSFSNEKLGNFMSRLSSETLFKEVVLKYAKETHAAQSDPDRETNESLIQFQIECKMYQEIQ